MINHFLVAQDYGIHELHLMNSKSQKLPSDRSPLANQRLLHVQLVQRTGGHRVVTNACVIAIVPIAVTHKATKKSITCMVVFKNQNGTQQVKHSRSQPFLASSAMKKR